jgi:elongation factor Ts
MEYVKAEEHENVAKYVANSAKAMGGSIKIASFVRYEKGEGIEKKEEDYAAEIAKLAGGNK